MYEVVVGIDFDSSRIGFAYSYFDKNKIIHGTINASDIDCKVPTEIILDEHNYVLAFGSDCMQFLKEKGLKIGHYFKGIIMNLYQNKYKIKAYNSGKDLPLITVIQKVFEEVKKIAIEEISSYRPYLKKETEKIKWVVTVPVIWDEHQKSVMMEACIGAGLINKNIDKKLFFVLEPEAAFLYCSIKGDINPNYLKKGEYYIVCNLGYEIGDIVAHLSGSNNNLSDVHPICGDNYGSNEIDKHIFKDIILKLFRCEDFNSFYLKYKKNNDIENNDEKGELFKDWCKLEWEIKDFKEGANNEKIAKKEKYAINCSIFQDLFDYDLD